MATLSVKLYSDVTSVNSVFVSDWIITVIILVLMCSLVSVFTLVTLHLLHFLHLLYLTLVTSCIIGPFLCYHLLYLIIYIFGYC